MAGMFDWVASGLESLERSALDYFGYDVSGTSVEKRLLKKQIEAQQLDREAQAAMQAEADKAKAEQSRLAAKKVNEKIGAHGLEAIPAIQDKSEPRKGGITQPAIAPTSMLMQGAQEQLEPTDPYRPSDLFQDIQDVFAGAGQQAKAGWTEAGGGMLRALGETEQVDYLPQPARDVIGPKDPLSEAIRQNKAEMAQTGQGIAESAQYPDFSEWSPTKRIFATGIGEAGAILPTVPFGPMGTVANIAGRTFGTSYQRGREYLSPSQASLYGLAQAGVEGLTEYGPAKALNTIARGNDVFGGLGRFLFQDLAGEQAALAGNEAVDYVTDRLAGSQLSPAQSPLDVLSRIAQQAPETAAITAVTGGALGGATALARAPLRRLTQEPQQAEALPEGTERVTPAGQAAGLFPQLNLNWLRVGNQANRGSGSQRIIERRAQRGAAVDLIQDDVRGTPRPSSPQFLHGRTTRPRQQPTFGPPTTDPQSPMSHPQPTLAPLRPAQQQPGQTITSPRESPAARIGYVPQAAVGFDITNLDINNLGEYLQQAVAANDQARLVRRQGQYVPNRIYNNLSPMQQVRFDEQAVRADAIRNQRMEEIIQNPAAVRSLLNLPRGTALRDEHLLAVGQLNLDSEANARIKGQAVIDKLRRGETPSDNDLLDFQLSMEQFSSIDARLRGALAEAGRSLRAARELKSQQERFRQSLQELNLGQMPPRQLDPAARSRLEELANAVSNAGTPGQAAAVMRNAYQKPGLIRQLWLSAMLSRPATHIRNLIGNTGMQAEEMIVNPLAWAIGAVDGAIGKTAKGIAIKSRYRTQMSDIKRQENAAIANNDQAKIQELAQRRAALEVSREAELQSESARIDSERVLLSDVAKRELFDPNNKANNALNDLISGGLYSVYAYRTGAELFRGGSMLDDPRALQTPGFENAVLRALNAEDAFFKYNAFAKRLRERIPMEARRQVQAEMERSGRVWFASEQRDARIRKERELNSLTPDYLIRDAEEFAKRVTFTDEVHNGFVQAMQKLRTPAQMQYDLQGRPKKFQYAMRRLWDVTGGAVWLSQMPFLKTPINILKHTAYRAVPGGPLLEYMLNTNLNESKYKKSELHKAIAKSGLWGAAVYGSFLGANSLWNLADAGLITGAPSDDAEEREAEALFRKPNSVKTPTGYMQISSLGPQFQVPLLVASIFDQTQRLKRARVLAPDEDKAIRNATISAATHALYGQVFEDSPIGGVLDLANIISGYGTPADKMRRIATDMAGQVMPGVVGDASQVVNGISDKSMWWLSDVEEDRLRAKYRQYGMVAQEGAVFLEDMLRQLRNRGNIDFGSLLDEDVPLAPRIGATGETQKKVPPVSIFTESANNRILNGLSGMANRALAVSSPMPIYESRTPQQAFQENPIEMYALANGLYRRNQSDGGIKYPNYTYDAKLLSVDITRMEGAYLDSQVHRAFQKNTYGNQDFMKRYYDLLDKSYQFQVDENGDVIANQYGQPVLKQESLIARQQLNVMIQAAYKQADKLARNEFFKTQAGKDFLRRRVSAKQLKALQKRGGAGENLPDADIEQIRRLREEALGANKISTINPYTGTIK